MIRFVSLWTVERWRSAQHRRSQWVCGMGISRRVKILAPMFDNSQPRPMCSRSDMMQSTPDSAHEDRQAWCVVVKLNQLEVIMWDKTCTPPSSSRTCTCTCRRVCCHWSLVCFCLCSWLLCAQHISLKQALQRRTKAIPTGDETRRCWSETATRRISDSGSDDADCLRRATIAAE